jgi:hypothetical protein
VARSGTVGLYLVSRDLARRLASLTAGDLPGRARHALLSLRKRIEGARVDSLRRVAGERTVVIEAGDAVLVLRPGGAGPALTLGSGTQAIATIGEGPQAWPPPQDAPERDWERLSPEQFALEVATAIAGGRSPVSAALSVCPGLGPQLARELDGTAESFSSLVQRLRTPSPTLVVPGAPEAWHDADLAAALAVAFSPIPLARAGERLAVGSWLQTAQLALEARQRGLAFEARRRFHLEKARRSLRRLEQLERNLASDLAGLDDEAQLRRQGEALLAFGHTLAPGAPSAELPDPYDPEGKLLIGLDVRLNVPANADRFFERARRIERARRQVEMRLHETSSSLAAARSEESTLLDARDLADFEPQAPADGKDESARTGPRHYLTMRGLSILVGRGARENHHLTFQVARPEDLWFHARDAPGAHVILRDNEGRASAEDLREAAEVAAFFSEARDSGQVDVHATRRKHVRPARGGPGRVFVAHSDTLRVHARDPEGRLRRR